MPTKGQPIRCRISARNKDTFRNMLGQCRKFNLLRQYSEQNKEIYILVSRRHHSLLQTIGNYDGVTVTEVSSFPEGHEVQLAKGREGVNEERRGRVFSRKQKEIKSGSVRRAEPFRVSKTKICGIPIHEIREWAHFLGKGEFLELHNLTHREFNDAVRALDTEVRISFTYCCPGKGCGQVFGGDDSLRAFRRHLLQTGHKKEKMQN